MRIFPLVFWPHIRNPIKAVSLLRKYRKVFGSDEGRSVLRDIMLQAGFGSVTPVDGPLERNEGKREIVAHILTILNLTEEEMFAYQKEATRLQTEFNQAQQELNNDGPEY